MNFRLYSTPVRFSRRAALVLAAVASLLSWLAGPISSAKATTPTVVLLTFDDSDLDQYTNALPLLEQYGMHGTFQDEATADAVGPE